jgi:hypothetical protein
VNDGNVDDGTHGGVISVDFGRLASLSVFYDPARWYMSVEESAVFERTDLHRQVTAQVKIPDGDFGSKLLDGLISSTSPVYDHFMLPVLWPKKGELLDLEPAQWATDEAVGSLRFASHEEHVDYSKHLIRERVLNCYLHPLLVDPDFDKDAALAHLDSVTDALCEIITVSPTEGRAILDIWFSRDSHHLKAYVGPRPVGEYRLYMLCEALCDRYLKLAVFPPILAGTIVRVSWVEHEAFLRTQLDGVKAARVGRFRWWRSFWDHAREAIGSTPSQLHFAARHARRSNHYSFKVQAPADHFLYRPVIIGEDRKPLPTMHSGSGGPEISVRRGGGSSSLVFVRHAPKSAGRLSFVASCFEMPPGSTGFAAASGMVLLLSMTMTLLIGANIKIPSGFDTAALTVAVVASSGVVASPLLPRGELYAAPLMTRAILVGNSAAGILFATTLIAYRAHAWKDAWLWDWCAGALRGPWVPLVCTALVAVGTVRLLIRTAQIIRLYRRAVLKLED